jgi:hypothetical protein
MIMKFSYFKNSKGNFGFNSIARGITESLSLLTPRFSAYIGEKILLKPYGRRRYNFKAIEPEKELNLQHQSVMLMLTYSVKVTGLSL